MKKRSMLAIASLAAGVVTALVTPPPQANAVVGDNPIGTPLGLLQEDQGAEAVLQDTVQDAGGALQSPETGGLL
ncbi:hypothetical protein [Streptomyces bikiniensis]|uniref:hypothetical protein n=1 Tax=Streptomyces bikiniensis TaxID=1896 RepID=UPI000ACE00CE|nr:hypothetical protein [Streptomyces bikiniensis]